MLQGRERGDMNAAVWRRVTAAAVDFVIVPSVSMIIMLITGALENAEAWTGGFPWLRVGLLGVVGYLLVNGVLLWRYGQTLGKRLVKIKIVDHESGQVPAMWKLIVVRAPFFPLMHATLIGFWYLLALDLLTGLRADRRCIHDWVSGTRVVAAAGDKD
ncbi:MAG: hypothetical protein CMP86_03265 [Gammaproteobacteria bacterium]|nr:hypothetical protein [Gammaproteobacteria bacterium]